MVAERTWLWQLTAFWMDNNLIFLLQLQLLEFELIVQGLIVIKIVLAFRWICCTILSPGFFKLMRLGVSNRIVVVESEIRIRSSNLVRFKIKRRIRVDDRDFDIYSIYFWLKLITFDLFSMYFWLKDRKRLSKCRLVKQKRQIISKTMICIQN